MLKLEKFLFYFLIFCLPFQTRKLIYQWGDSFNEWTSAYIYLTDTLLILVFLLWAWRVKKQRFLKNPLKLIRVKSPGFWLAAFLIIGLVSLVQARNLELGFYQWVKLLEMIGLFFYLKCNFKRLFYFEKLAYIFIASGLFQSIIAIGQYVQQKSLGLRIFTESPLSPEIAGVAKIIVNGAKMIRAYGTLPHPNVLGLFLLVAILFVYFLWLNKKHSFINYLFLSIIFFFLFFALFLTYSRLVIFTFLLSSIIYFTLLFKKRKKQIFSLFFLFLVSCFLFLIVAWPEIYSRFQISMDEQAVGLRSFYNQTSLLIIQEHPLLGIGFGNFVWEIRQMLDLLSPWLYQPVHNIYLLIASEIGLIGLMVFLFFIFRLFLSGWKENKFLILIFSSFLFIGLFDHFFWTLQQGQLIFWLVLGCICVCQLTN